MNASLVQSKQFNQSHDKWLIFALVASLFLHVTFAYIVPSFKSEQKKEKSKELKVKLVKIQAPKPVVVPEPPKPEPPKPKPKRKPKPRPIKKKVVHKPKPTPQPEPEPVVEQTPEPVEAPPPVITAAPTPEPEFVAPEPPPPPPPEPEPEPAGPTQADIDAYRNQLYAEFKRNQRYPKMAQRRGTQGDVGLSIGLDANGNITSVTVIKSSGSNVLDKAAIKTVKKSNIKPLMPDILKGQINHIKVTLSFKLQ